MRERKDKIALHAERLFDLLCSFAEQGKSCPSTMRMRETLNCAERSIEEAIYHLKDLGRIDCVSRGGGGRIVTILVGPQAGKSTGGAGIYYPRDVGQGIRLDDDLMNYGQGFGPYEITPPDSDSLPFRMRQPDARTYGGNSWR